MLHKHHIIPKHMGGTNHPSNLVYLTVEEHAEAHLILWIAHKRYGDKIAHVALANQVSISEMSKMKQKLGQYQGGLNNYLKGNLDKIRSKESSSKGGKKHSIEHMRMLATKGDKVKKGLGGKKGGKTTSSYKVLCHECGMISTPVGIANHQKKTNHILKERI